MLQIARDYAASAISCAAPVANNVAEHVGRFARFERCWLPNCAYIKTLARSVHPPSSFNSWSVVPFFTSQLAQVLRMSCHRKLSILVTFSAAYQPAQDVLASGFTLCTIRC